MNETLPRYLPKFSLQFYTTSDYNPADDTTNYDELESFLGMYLEDRFEEVFNNTPTDHLYTDVSVNLTENPLIIDVYVTANFRIPGQVPTKTFLAAQTQNAFVPPEDTEEYITDFDYLIKFVRTMKKTNPFHKTVDIVFEPTEDFYPIGTADTAAHSSHWVALHSMIGIAAFISAIITVLYYIKKRRDSQYIIDDGPLQLQVVKPRDGINGTAYCDDDPSSHFAEEESLRHLDAVRKEYARSNNLPEISLVDHDVTIDPQLEPSGSYEAPIFVDYKDNVKEEQEETTSQGSSQGSGEYSEESVESEEDGSVEAAEEVSVDESFEDEFPAAPQESKLSRFERLLGRAQGHDSDGDETMDEEILEEDEEESSYEEETVASQDEDLLNLVSVQLHQPARASTDPPQQEAEVGTKDLFSLWENNGNKRTSAPVANLDDTAFEESTEAASKATGKSSQKTGLFSYWETKLGNSTDDDDDDDDDALEDVDASEPTEPTLV